MVIYVEFISCNELRKRLKKMNIFVKCFQGSKRYRLRVDGVPDDDLDFALRFLRTCEMFRAKKCVAVVRDPRVEEIINELLDTEFEHLKSKTSVVRTKSFSISKEELEKLVIELVTNNTASK